MSRLVLAVFPDEADADAAAKAMDDWAGERAYGTFIDDHPWQSMGVLVLDSQGNVKTHKLGPRHVIAGAGIGLVLGAIVPGIAVAAMVVGGVAGGLYREGLSLSIADVDRLRLELQGGKAAVGVMTDASREKLLSSRLVELGGVPEAHDVDDATLLAADAQAAPAAAPGPSSTAS